MKTSIQNNSTRTDIYSDLSKTASGMEVTCLSEQYMQRSNDVILRDQEDDGAYVKDDGIVVDHAGKEYRVTAKGLMPIRERRVFLGNDDVADGVKVIRSNGVAYIRSGQRSVSVWSTDSHHNAVCRCGWKHSVERHYVTRDGAYGPLPYDEMFATALTLMKFVGLHDAWHLAND